MTSDNLNKLSEKLLLNVKLKKETSSLQLHLENITVDHLRKSLTDDKHKKAFWINIYNAYFQILRVDKKITKPEIYRKKLFKVAGKNMSLDDIEHGILRKYRYKYSLGFFANFFTSRFIKTNAVDVLDYRIHFALNCGAKSCPPIAFYNSKNIDAQLDMASQAFLEAETKYNEENKIVHTTALFKWFYGDFGGKKGIIKIYKDQLNKDISDYKIAYNDYSWEEELDNFVND